MRTYQNFIGGEWVSAKSGQAMRNSNPADTREVVAEYPVSGKHDALAAIEAATNAHPGWAGMTPVARGRVLSKASQILESRKAELAELLTREEGKTLAESTGEVQRAIVVFRFFCGISYTLGGQTIPHDLPQKLLYTRREPLGLVAWITPWNFPIAIPAWKMAPALVAGNAVVIKPATQAPAMTLELARALAEAGLPRGGVHIVVGEGRAVGGELAGHPKVAALSFTGSYSVGNQVYQQLAARMARPQMEMGGKNPTIVLADADLDLAARLVAIASFGLTGQACTATSRVIVEKGVAGAFGQKLVERAGAIQVGNGLREGVTMGPAVSKQQLAGNLEYVDIATGEGAAVLYGGQRPADGDFARGNFMQPTVLGNVAPRMRIACEEVFGPVVGIIPVENFEEAIRVANGVDVGLSASIVTRDLRKAMLYTEQIEAGVGKVDQVSTGLALQAPLPRRPRSARYKARP